MNIPLWGWIGFIGFVLLLKYGLAAILVFVGIKMLLVDVAPIPIAASLIVVVGILATSMIASRWSVPQVELPAELQ